MIKIVYTYTRLFFNFVPKEYSHNCFNSSFVGAPKEILFAALDIFFKAQLQVLSQNKNTVKRQNIYKFTNEK